MAEPFPEKEIDELYELPDGWIWVRLSDVINDFQPGFACGARDDRGYVQLRMNNIGLDGRLVLEKTLRVPIEKTNMGKYNLRIGDILFNNTNSVELIGKTALFMDEVKNCVFSNHITRIRPDTQLINSKYLLNVFINDYNRGIFRMMCHRFVGQAGISRKKLLEHTLPLPPIPEQHRIVAKLESLLAQVNRSKDHLVEVPLLIKRFRQSVLAAACSGRLTEDWRREHPDVEPASELLNRIREERIRRYDEECRKAEAEGRRKPKKPKNLEVLEVDTEGLPELPEGWVWCKIENFIRDFQPGFACGARDDRGYVQLRMNNIGLDGSVVLEKTLRVPIEKTNIEKYNLRMGDILFNNTNSVELIGKTALFRDEIQNCVFSNHITRIRPDVRVVTPKFLLYLFNDTYNKGIFQMMCHRFVGQAGISREKLLEHTLPLPPLLEQRAIAERVERVFHFADEVEQRVAAATTHANQLTQSTLARAFRGELVPQDPNDESVSVLLERIKQERAKNEMEKKTGKRKTETLLDYC
jgi:type I restriction enzyme S subunit